VLGLVAVLALAVPWITSWFTKPQATLYGAAATGAMLLVALFTRRGWIRSGRFGFLSAAAAEQSAADLSTAVEVLTLEEAVAVRQTYPSSTLLALRQTNPALCREAAHRAQGMRDAAVYLVCVDEIPGFLFPPRRGPSAQALRVLRTAVEELRVLGIDAVPIWRLAHDAGASIAETAEDLGVSCVFIGHAQRSTFLHFLQGSVLKRLIAELPDEVHVVICQ
jgi:nucleotide-binding universal stress UspA family protein